MDENRTGGMSRRWRIAALVVLTAVAIALFSVLVPLHAAAYGSWLPTTFLFAAPAVAAPLLSLRYPSISMLLFTAAALLLPLTVGRDSTDLPPWPWSVPLLIAFVVFVVVLTFRYGWRRGLVELALGTAAGLVASIMQPAIPSGNSLIVTTSVASGLYLIAVLLAGRLRLGDELTRERAHTAQEQARRELVEERTRIARELHDVVAHSMSVIQVQASTARYRVADLAPEVAAEFDDIAASARTALAEMRRVLGVLRTEDHEAELAPQRGIDDIPALVETVRRAGAQVALSLAVSGDVAPSSQVAAYRIVQEALSNAVRHAAGTAITVIVSGHQDDVAMSIRNAIADDGTAGTGGHGVRGMIERAELIGGTLTAGAAGDDWVVQAELPRHPTSETKGAV